MRESIASRPVAPGIINKQTNKKILQAEGKWYMKTWTFKKKEKEGHQEWKISE